MSSLPLASVLLLVLASSTSAAPQSAAQLASPPAKPLNVVLVVVDDVGHDLLGSFSRDYRCRECPPNTVPDPCTPNLDALAAQGMRFTNVWSSPWCTPTRAQIMTGKEVRRLGTGLVTNPSKPRRGLDPDETTIADLVPFAAAVGKWHLAEAGQGWEHPLQCGFETFSGTLWNLNPLPEDGPNYLDWRRYDGISPPVRTYEYATKVTTDDALTQLDALNTVEAPWLLYVSYAAIHVPFHCPPNPPQPGSTPCTQDWWGDCDVNCSWAKGICRVYAMVQALDYEIGRLLQSVDPTNTAVIVLGDNGTAVHAKNPPFAKGSKGTMYQGGINVPLIARVPGIAPGSETHELVSVQDLYTTVADLTQVPIPAGIQNLDSVSLAQYLSPAHLQAPAAPRDHVYAETFTPNFRPRNGQPVQEYKADYHLRAIRNDRFKLIERVTPGGVVHEMYSLYNTAPGAPPAPQNPALTPDPHELRDLVPLKPFWGANLWAQYNGLVGELVNNHPALPVK